MQFVVSLDAEVLVDVPEGGAAAALEVAKTHVANGWLLRYQDGAMKGVGYFSVKGLSAEVMGARPFMPNKRVDVPQPGEKEDLF